MTCKKIKLKTNITLSPGEGNGNPLQYSCQENSKDRRGWWSIVHGGGHKVLDMTEQLTLWLFPSLININQSAEQAKLHLYPSYIFSWDSVTKRQIKKKKTVY